MPERKPVRWEVGIGYYYVRRLPSTGRIDSRKPCAIFRAVAREFSQYTSLTCPKHTDCATAHRLNSSTWSN